MNDHTDGMLDMLGDGTFENADVHDETFTPAHLAIPADATLAEIRAIVNRQRWTGIDCPACGQYARVYLRRLNRSMAVALLRMYRSGGVGIPVHTPSVLKGNRGEEARLSYWGLTAPAPRLGSPHGSPPIRGWWSVTRRGALWLLDGVTVPAAAVIYNGTCLRMSGPPTSIRDALDDPGFNLRELLDTYAPADTSDGPPHHESR